MFSSEVMNMGSFIVIVCVCVCVCERERERERERDFSSSILRCGSYVLNFLITSQVY